MDATAFKPTRIPVPARRQMQKRKAGCRQEACLVVSGHKIPPGPLIAPTILECHVGEGRRCVAHHEAREVSAGTFEVVPRFVRVVGGGPDLLRGRLDQGQAIPGRFAGLNAAYAAAVAWTQALNDIVD